MDASRRTYCQEVATNTHRTSLARPVLMLVVAVLGALACAGQASESTTENNAPPSAQPAAQLTPAPTKVVLVGPRQVACKLGACVQVYDAESGEYQVDQQSVPGLVYVNGYVWEVQVQETTWTTPVTWQLMQILSKERVAGEITITEPRAGGALPSDGVIHGAVKVTPADGQLAYRVYDAAGNLLGTGPISTVQGEGATGSFEGSIQFGAYQGPGRIEVMDLYGPVGFVGHATAVDVYLGMASPPETRPAPLALEGRTISIDRPDSYSIVTPTFEVRGQVTISPFESTLGYHVLGSDGNLLAAGSMQVQAEMGQPGTFSGSISLPETYRGPARLVIFEGSAADGLILASATLDVFATGVAQP